ncbi:hypothetical protein COR50_01880 [Chitinophaga caeni]|uniref:ABC-2 type transporter transmembrane domain-containing protein n=1 Tax=Chitinophaga caeni TaxID=2029983 RepID=A0A291QQ03_9BACT|nr:ABC transporter permease [Chitinophaga caeni]ATL46011.1 hypothetical protein COR50_01880 [Chitinophaga caeni]
MNKIWLIIKREYLARVRKKSFLVLTILTPIFIIALMVVPALLARTGNAEKRIVVVDESKLFENRIPDGQNEHFIFNDQLPFDSLRTSYAEKGFTGLLHIPKMDNLNRPPNIVYYGEGQLNIMTKSSLESKINNVIEDLRMEKAGIDKSKLDDIRSNVDIISKTGKEEKEGSAEISLVIGYASGFIIYIILLLFGMMVMRGVMEEKMNRIAEVMVSSVKPFQLMMGKILGIGAVGLTQFIIWIGLIYGLAFLVPLFISPAELAAAQANSPNPSAGVAIAQQLQHIQLSANWPLITFCFVFYFLGGYIFYSSLFAAVGSLVNEDPNDAQGLTFPITLPIIIAILIMMKAVTDPNSSLAVWGSIIPFTSPVVMMARIPYGVPGTVTYWQLALSMGILVIGFLFTTWVAGRVYRTGILLYGKKVTWGEALKWIFRKN